MNSKTKAKLGVYSIAILMMGVIGVSSSLSTIAANFPEASQTMIMNMISIPCLIIIPVTLITGKLMDFIAKKTLVVFGILFFLIGGIAPAFMDSLSIILILRGIFGIGVGLIQTLTSAIVAENFSGPEKDEVQGNATSAQMLGCIIMSYVGGWLGSLSWNKVFLVHLIGFVSLIGVLAFVPYTKPIKSGIDNINKEKVKLAPATWFWSIACLVFFIAAQAYSNALSFLINEKSLGTAAQAGSGLAFFALGGFIMGLIFGKIIGKIKKATMSVGFIILGISYLIIAFATGMPMIYLGSFISGLAVSTIMPCIIVEAGNSVNPVSAGMAIAIATCFQNLGMFLSPYIINPIAVIFGKNINNNQMIFIICATLALILGGIAMIWGLNQNKKVVNKKEMAA